jgi:hypothetical protein
MFTNVYQKGEKRRSKYECVNCDYHTFDKTKYNVHLQTNKHKMFTFDCQNVYEKGEKGEKGENINLTNKKNKQIVCDCGRLYKYKQSLYVHKKKCQFLMNNKTENQSLHECIMLLIQENKEFKTMVIENQKQITTLIPKIGNNNTQNNTQNTQNNNKFSINVFLNEQCKDAMSMNEFIDTIEISLQDIIKTKDEGFASGISNIFIKGMNKLSPYQRPLHCTDVKREVLYVKNDKWEKDVTKEKINNAIKSVSAKQFKHINKYTDANPDFMQNDAKREEYFNIVKNTTDSIEDNRNKILKNICPTVHVKMDAECEAIDIE